MNRRDFLRTGAAAAAGWGSIGTLEAKGLGGTRRRRPNVLYVFSDQHRACSVPGQPFNEALAPNLAAFRDSNTSMEQCISNYPLCTPYRAIFMSGLYPQQSGVMGNEQILSPDVGPLGETFRNAGYRTGYVGKWHIHGQDRVGREDGEFIPKGPYRMGFEDWHVWANTNEHWDTWTFNQDTGEKIFRKGWNASFMTDEAIDFMEAQSPDKPWFLVLSWNPPHPPFDPPADDAARYSPDAIRLRPNVRVLPETDLRKGVRSEAALHDAAQKYMGAVTAIDAEFARVLQALEDTGQADDTIVIYTSDHGEMLGSHGLMGKRVPFEESCRVPFFVRYPGATTPGYKSDSLFAAVDIYPTLCGLAGVPVPAHCAGRDLSDAVLARHIDEPDCVFMLSQPEPRHAGDRRPNLGTAGKAAVGGRTNGCPPYRGVRTRTHTYIVADTGRWLLYDNLADPFQKTNLVEDKRHAALMATLDTKIAAWLRSVDDSFPYTAAVGGIYRLAQSQSATPPLRPGFNQRITA